MQLRDMNKDMLIKLICEKESLKNLNVEELYKRRDEILQEINDRKIENMLIHEKGQIHKDFILAHKEAICEIENVKIYTTNSWIDFSFLSLKNGYDYIGLEICHKVYEGTFVKIPTRDIFCNDLLDYPLRREFSEFLSEFNLKEST